MAEKKISQLVAATAGNLDGTALVETSDKNLLSVKTTYAQLRTALLAGGANFGTTDGLTAGAAGAAITAVQGTAISGTDTAAGALTIIANLSTGAGAPGTIVLQAGQILGTGTTVQTAANLAIFRQGATTAISEWVFGQATARIVGGSTNGLAVRDSTNARDNFLIADNGTSAALTGATYATKMFTTSGSGELRAGGGFGSNNASTHTAILAGFTGNTGGYAQIIYYNQTQYYAALEVANVASGFGTLALMKSGGDVLVGPATATATNATQGFVYISTCAGAPTGTPALSSAGQTPHIYDTTNHKIWFYDHGTSTWKGVAVA